jgi:hypothetical protein
MDFDTDMLDAQGHSFTVIGSPSISTTVVKSGTGSLLIPDVAAAWNAHLLRSDPSLDFVFAGDFTIEAWLLKLNQSTWNGWLSTNSNAGQFGRTTNAWGNKLSFNFGGGVVVDTTETMPLGTWVHACVERYNGVIRAYYDGQLTGNTVNYSGPVWDGYMEIGAGIPAGDNEPWRGHVDRLRIWKEARYQHTNFTPEF